MESYSKLELRETGETRTYLSMKDIPSMYWLHEEINVRQKGYKDKLQIL